MQSTSTPRVITSSESLQEQSEIIHYQVIHATEGRFRIRIPQVTYDSEYASKLNLLVKSLEFVTDVRINPAASSLIVSYEATRVVSATAQQKLFNCIQQADSAEISLEVTFIEPRISSKVNTWERLSLPMLALSVAILAGPLQLSIPSLLVGGLIIGASIPIFKRAIVGIVDEHKINVDILDSLLIAIQILLGEFVSSALIVSLIELGELMRDRIAHKVQLKNLELLDLSDLCAWVERDGQQQQIPLKHVLKGDKVTVHAGEMILVNGLILQGTGLIDKYNLTGETKPIGCYEGQEVVASTKLVKGQLNLMAQQTGLEAYITLMAQFLKAKPMAHTRVGSQMQEISNQLVVPSLLMSGSIFALTGNSARSLASLQLDFGSGIEIAVPTTVLSAMDLLDRSNVFVHDGRVLEALAHANVVIFGKTGTLTEASATVIGILTSDAATSTEQVLTYAASVEQELTHPIASAIVSYAAENGIQPRTCEAWDYQIGIGITARMDGQKILVGSSCLLQEAGIDLDLVHRQHPELKRDSYSLVYVARDDELIGVILLDNPLRKESSSTIAALSDRGIKSILVTGDSPEVALAIGEQLGIGLNDIYGEASPQQKAEVVRRLQQQGKTVAYIAHGLSDTEAITNADISICFAKKTELERETADVIILEHDLQAVVNTIDVAKHAMEIVYQNIAIVTLPNISFVIAGLIFGVNPAWAEIINNGAAIIAQMNSILLDSRTLTEGDETDTWVHSRYSPPL